MSMRWVMVAVTALVTSLGLAAPAQADVTPVTKTGWSRWSGADRYATAVAVSKATFQPQVDTVFVVSGQDYPDALAAGPVAGSIEAPVLLTKRDSLPSVVAAELGRLDPVNVIVVGGTLAITDATLAAVEAASGASATRIAGATRYATAAALAASLDTFETVYVVSGQTYADAMSAGPAAGKETAPLLLTAAAALSPDTQTILNTAKPSRIVLVGGTTALSAKVEADIKKTVPGASVIRHGGRDRYDTARKVVLSLWGASADVAFYVPGGNFPDALSATPAAIVNDAPLLLTTANCHPYETAEATTQLSPNSRIAVGAAGVTYAGSTTCGPQPTYPFAGGDLDCIDYPSQAAAQTWFNYWYPRVGDIFRLDGDNDGLVCEVWPPRT